MSDSSGDAGFLEEAVKPRITCAPGLTCTGVQPAASASYSYTVIVTPQVIRWRFNFSTKNLIQSILY